MHDAARRGSSATPDQREASEGRLLWVTGFGLSDGTAMGLDERALVVFLQLTGTEKGERRRLEVLRDRAVVATEMSFTITDPRRADDPLIWVNPAFTRLTGYSSAEVVGSNCRLLQGSATDRAAITRIRAALRDRVPITEVLLNYRRDGTAFWNQVSISPVFDGAGDLVNFVGVQNDVTERVLVEQERRAALADAEEARAQLRLLAEATTEMTAAPDVGDACTRLARIVVPQLADLCAVDLLDRPGEGSARRIAVAARDSADEAQLHLLSQARRYRVGSATETGTVLAGGEPRLLADLPEAGAERYPDDAAAAAAFDRLRLRSAIVVPVRARGRVLGSLTLYTQHPYGRRYSARDLHLATDLAGRAGLAVDNARLYETEHAAVITLQHSLLPALPKIDGLQLAARYLVGVDGNQVGGDWYDVLPLPDGAVGVAVGDVVGHDLRAAAAMGQLRGVLRSYAWDGGGPGSVLDRCDQLVQGLEMAAMATAVYARIEPPAADGSRLVRYANAGHPAPLVLTPDGRSPAAGRAAFADDRGGARSGSPHRRGPHRGPGCAARRAACSCSTPTGSPTSPVRTPTSAPTSSSARWPASHRAHRPRRWSSAWWRSACPRSSATTSRCWSWAWTAPLIADAATHGLLSTVRRSATSGARLCGAQPVHCDGVPTAVRGVGGVAAMSAVPEMGLASPGSAEGFTMVSAPVRDADRRVVAIAIDAVELLRPGRIWRGCSRASAAWTCCSPRRTCP